MFDAEIVLHVFQFENIKFQCRPTPIKSTDRRIAEYVLDIFIDGRVYSRIDLTDNQRKQLMLALSSGPHNEPITLLAGPSDK